MGRRSTDRIAERSRQASARASAFDSRREPVAVNCHRVGVRADLTVLVPRDADGGLDDGVAAVVERIDGVRIHSVDVTDLTPRLNDLAVEATVDLTVDVEALDGTPDPDAATVSTRETLDAGFGVTVDGLQVEA